MPPFITAKGIRGGIGKDKKSVFLATDGKGGIFVAVIEGMHPIHIHQAVVGDVFGVNAFVPIFSVFCGTPKMGVNAYVVVRSVIFFPITAR